jgi:hypothetical protein
MEHKVQVTFVGKKVLNPTEGVQSGPTRVKVMLSAENGTELDLVVQAPEDNMFVQGGVYTLTISQ